MSALSLDAKRLRRSRWAWYMYDFGNSAYAAVVLLAVYSAYFEGQVVGADTRLRNLEDLLGGVLVRTGRITDDPLQEALRLLPRHSRKVG